MRKLVLAAAAVMCAWLGGCAAEKNEPLLMTMKPVAGSSGYLVPMGGATSDENRAVYDRFVALASPAGREPVIVIVPAASLDQISAAESKLKMMAKNYPQVKTRVLTRETSEAEGVAMIDGATGLFFTGGDQKRVVDRYRAKGADSPEAAAMHRLLRRGGVIGGTSAGDAMMSDPMFLTGRSAEALGVASTRTAPGPDDDEEAKAAKPKMGPQIGKGMGFTLDVITDSHFFERNRVGRLVAALEVSGTRLGLGVGENAAAEIDLATGWVKGLSERGELAVDAGCLRRDGLNRLGVLAKVLRQGDRMNLTEVLGRTACIMHPQPTGEPIQIDPTEAGQKASSASWRFFDRASNDPAHAYRLKLDGWTLTGWSNGDGWVAFDITVP